MSDLDSMTEPELKKKIQELREKATTTKKKFDNILKRKCKETQIFYEKLQKREAQLRRCVSVVESNKEAFQEGYRRGNEHFRQMRDFLRSENQELQSKNQLLRRRLRELSAENQYLKSRLCVVSNQNKRRRTKFSELTF